MKSITIIIVVPDEQAEALDRAIYDSQLLNDWAVWIWSTEKATPEMLDWYENYYLGEEVIGHA